MNSKERVSIALEHKEPDRVPLFEAWIEAEVVAMLGEDPCIARKRLGLDCLPISTHPSNTKAYGHGVDEWGRIFKHGQYGGGLIKNYKDLERFTAPLSHAKDWFSQKRIAEIRREYKDEFALYFAWHDCSLGLSYLSMGMIDFFKALYEQPEFAEAVIQRSTEWTIALVEQANGAEVDFIVLGDDAADNSRSMISPKMFRALILPEYKKIVRASDVPILWHSDGNIGLLLPMIVEAGFAGVHSLEPKAQMDLGQIKAQFGNKLILAGNLDATYILCQKDMALVRKDVERCIRQGAPNGGYFFSSSNSLFEGHHLEAIIEAYHHAKKVGKYPIAAK
ncbi:MAG: uroporphyrinogen decarboxylase family protein [Candidatus Heimdallarchaeota archaeon]